MCIQPWGSSKNTVFGRMISDVLCAAQDIFALLNLLNRRQEREDTALQKMFKQTSVFFLYSDAFVPLYRSSSAGKLQLLQICFQILLLCVYRGRTFFLPGFLPKGSDQNHGNTYLPTGTSKLLSRMAAPEYPYKSCPDHGVLSRRS